MATPHAHPSPLLAHAEDSPLVPALQAVHRAAETGTWVLAWGEPGSGKGELARCALTGLGRRRLHVVPCRAMGALDVSAGVQEAAGGEATAEAGEDPGALFLEEVGELTAENQGRLAQLLAGPLTAGEPWGGWVLATSAVDLQPRVAAASFRRDLYERLPVRVHLPPLRERRDDVLAVVDRAWPEVGRNRLLSRGARALLHQYDWPGNARELLAFLQRLSTRASGFVITVRDVERELFQAATGATCWGPPQGEALSPVDDAPLPDVLRETLLALGPEVADEQFVDLNALLQTVEWSLVQWALRQTHGSRVLAARKLGIQRTTLVEKIRRRRPTVPDRPASDAVRADPQGRAAALAALAALREAP